MADELTNIKNFPVANAVASGSRSMPQNLPAEQNLLGAILLDNSVLERIDDRLESSHFYDPLHGRIYDTMRRLINRGQLANPLTLRSYFSNDQDSTIDDVDEYLSNFHMSSRKFWKILLEWTMS